MVLTSTLDKGVLEKEGEGCPYHLPGRSKVCKNNKSRNKKPVRKAMRTRQGRGEEDNDEATTTMQGHGNDDEDDAMRTRR